ncbi:PREDICTED: cytochrome c oxidase subunit 6A, mitochondrial-like isoform X2 [Branchiostoma belcheri]|uniref:Cytochrome c oxidase subunit n=1 Tax=Branchiostoma belcheri TaxID=7741 RepID=A0A6P4YEU3_BRABE|nr:PREDICTED: cytochrome c oxidase subunit 6A, mitochondrial-like isoform X2 [Branchiostoma belcheri]XP_019617268.1 PREDICTED: cytochrome c oxidase subunit 6A, mitochondrial-like isoform X2 [Branchiostoma belcheri]KAI8480601.1 Cytochrome c oxidase subunit 6A1, mitochondrial [Branchiostoma belcheri]
MATMLTNVLRTAVRSRLQVTPARPASGAAPAGGEHSGGMDLWKKMSVLVALPALVICMLNAYLKEKEHHEHPRPEFLPYNHLRIRSKPFPWGDGVKSLFHNPHNNALPDVGYEDEH